MIIAACAKRADVLTRQPMMAGRAIDSAIMLIIITINKVWTSRVIGLG